MTKTARQACVMFTTVLSWTLALLVVGAMAMAVIITRHAVQLAHNSTGVTIALDDNTPSLAIDSLQQLIEHRPYTAHAAFISRDVALQQWNRETGEDLLATLGENPLCDVIELRLKAGWTSADSLRHVEGDLRLLPGVADVATNVVDANHIKPNGKRWLLFMGIAAAILLVLATSLVWASVQMRLADEKDRIDILSLVGATRSFIVRPYVTGSAAWGTLAALLASMALVAVWVMACDSQSALATVLSRGVSATHLLAVSALLLVLGTVATAVTAWVSCVSRLEY